MAAPIARELDYLARVREGKRAEEEVAEALRRRFGLIVLNVTENLDRNEKIDRIVVAKRGGRRTLQIKCREYGHDILFDVYEPFYGEEDPRTGKGRDLQSTCDLYACRVGPALHLIHGTALRRLVQQTLDHWRGLGSPTAVGTTAKAARGILLRIRADRHSGRPKMLLFIPALAFDSQNIWTKLLVSHVSESTLKNSFFSAEGA
jgi:hypothetical protein